MFQTPLVTASNASVMVIDGTSKGHTDRIPTVWGRESEGRTSPMRSPALERFFSSYLRNCNM